MTFFFSEKYNLLCFFRILLIYPVFQDVLYLNTKVPVEITELFVLM